MSGIVFYETNNKKLLKDTLSVLKHRGRNCRRIIEKGTNIMGITTNARKNSINKVTSENGDTGLVVDGWIYNNRKFDEFTEKFRNKDYSFLEDIEGIFSLMIAGKDNYLIARDPFGTKPLYYGEIDNKLVFASEMKAIVPFTDTVEEFPPGHYYTPDKGFQRYFSIEILSKRVNKITNTEKASEIVKEAIYNAIKKRLDHFRKKPVIFLSGGLDSSCVAAAVAKQVKNVKSFAVGNKNSEDLKYARKVAKKLGFNHHEYKYDIEEMLKILPDVIYYLESFDESLVRSAIPNFLVAKLAKNNNGKIVFMGEGSDELFGGYHYLKNLSLPEMEKEMINLANSGHHMGFQRDDRMNIANGLEYDVPFMDKQVVESALSIPADWKIFGREDKIEKWILRKAYENELPKEVVWRRKNQFSKGAGSSESIESYASEIITDREFKNERHISDKVILRSKEELFYYRIFKKFFPYKRNAEIVGRWEPLMVTV
ncbi:MAG: asparagine synthase-related protein [Kosmotogaceae bacterium]